MTDPNYNNTAPSGTADAERSFFGDRLRHASWSSIFLGLVIAIAVQIMLSLLGLGLGLTIIDPTDPMGGLGSWSIAGGIYVVVINIIALFIGGYVASRLAPARTDQSAVFHGMSIWALATIIMVWIGTTTAGMAISGISSAVSGIASATGQAVEAVVPDDLDLGSISYQNLPEPVRQTLEENDVTPQDLQQEVRAAFRDVVSQQEQQRLMQRLQQTLQAILRSPADAPEEIEQAVDDMFGQGGILNEQDLNQMQNTLQRRLNLSDQDVQQITNQVEQGIQEAGESIKQAIEEAQQQAAETAKAVSDQIGRMALWLFFANVLGLIAAVVGGRLGEVKTPLAGRR